jgi:hypothetical protein
MTDTMRRLALCDLIEALRNRASKRTPVIEPEKLDEAAYHAGRFLGTSALIVAFVATAYLLGSLAMWWSI